MEKGERGIIMVWTIGETIEWLFTIPDAIGDWVCGLPFYVAIIVFFIWGGFGVFAEKMGWGSDKERVAILWKKHLEEE